jgi:hypothetical protein
MKTEFFASGGDGDGTAERLVGSPPARRWLISLGMGGMRFRSCRLVAMSMTMRMTTGGSERTNPFDYLTM